MINTDGIKKILPIIIIIFIAFLTWYKILFHFPVGEGYFYFAPSNYIDFKFITFASILSYYSFFAQFIFAILVPIFRDNISFYMYFQFTIMILTYLTFYYVLLKIFKDKLLAFISTIFFIANYVGQVTMMGLGDYQRFIQRVPELIPTFLSFLFLVYFIREGKIRNLFISIIVYTLALVFEHYTSFFLPLFVFLLVLDGLLNNRKNIIKNVIIALFFVSITIGLTRTDSLSRPNYSIFNFALTTPKLSQMVFYQISMTGFPIQFTEFMAKHSKPPLSLPYTKIMTPVLIIIFIYLYLAFLKIRKNKELLTIYFSLILSLLTVCFLIMYAYNAVPNPLINFGQDRIYFVHSIFFAIIWGIVIKAFFAGLKINNYRKLYVLIVLVFLLQNIPLIWTDIDSTTIHSEIIRKFLQTAKTLSPNFNKNTILVAPWEPLTASSVISDFYNMSPNKFLVYDDSLKAKLPKLSQDKNNVYILDFKYSTDAYGVGDKNSVKIIDYTEFFRKTGTLPK